MRPVTLRRPPAVAVATLAVAALTAGLPAAPVSARASAQEGATAGSVRSGDSLFPRAGNGGYDVTRYRVDLDYRPSDNHLRARTRVVARAARPLSSYSLDLEGLTVQSVTVDGTTASFERQGHELVVTPTSPVDGRFATTVRYAGNPLVHTDPDESAEGWIATSDGATALNEPVGSMTWFPVNNTPRDKARYTFRVTAPSNFAVAGNGVLDDRTRHGDRTTWTWRQPAPMASYLAMVSIGHYDVFHSTMRTTTGRVLPVWSFVQKALPSQRKARNLLPRIVRWSERHFGAYPFASTGLVAHRLDVGYALETQDRPVFPGGVATIDLVHEVVHQWYGDSVTPRDWGDIWLNEGFATYAEWMWEGAHGGRTPAETFRHAYRKHRAGSSLWSPAPVRLTDPADLFGAAGYQRGAMTLQALRARIGGPAFFRVLRTWARSHRHGSGSTAGFIRLSEQVSGQQLDKLFRDWLVVAKRPQGY